PPPSSGKATGTNAPYQVGGIWYVPREQPNYNETGIASWYGDAFQLKATADGEIFDMNQFSAAHTTLPLPSMVEVTNLDNGRKLTVRVNDRGPFVGGRIIDLSRAAAAELGYERSGTAHVRVKYVGPAPLAGPQAGVRYASNSAFAPHYPINRVSVAAAAAPLAASAPAVSAAPLKDGGEVVLTSLKSPEAVSVSTLASLPAAKPAPVAPSIEKPLVVAHAEPAASGAGAYRIQAGAFSDQENARRAAAQLASTGAATIEPIERNGLTLYRVTLPGPADEAEAYAFRDKVAAIGFNDARVLRPAVQ
ncbi:MAG TPA: septal ring lytic transglycosylase RlpA family protein, partial [Phenylobacterium sp.]